MLRQSTTEVSLAALEAGDEPTRRRLAECLHTDGFCSIVLDGAYSGADVERLFSFAKAFFALPPTHKSTCRLADNSGLRGYVGLGEERTSGIPDLKESFEFALDRGVERLPPPYDVFTVPNLWPNPEFVAGFRDAMEYYAESMAAAGAIVFEAMVSVLERSATSASCAALKFGDPHHYSRIIHYPTGGVATDRHPLVAHCDHSFFTIALQEVPGLELEGNCGEWLPALAGPEQLTVFPGEIAEIWSAGYFRSARHRVGAGLAPKGRLSVATFVLPDLRADVAPLGDLTGKIRYRLRDAELERMRQIFDHADSRQSS